MKKISLLLLIIAFSSCSSLKKPMVSEPLYDVLFGDEFGGGSFQFYEIISEENEFKMLLGDAMIKPYVTKDDIKNSNFILVNLGEKPSDGYKIKVQKIEELSDKILITIKEVVPENKVNMVKTKPCFVIKIKSKKPIEIK
ncbi:MAG: protease complex subunit PrcB family protein [Flavobacterium sp.]|nr:protease complex subunit PrcB family protein [Flavobacterium sp.]